MFIYLIVNHETGKYYVGQHKGTNLQKYLQQKFSHAQREISKGSHLYNSMRAHPDSSVWSIHALRSDIQNREDLNQIEKDFIRFLRSQDPEYGYNICSGGEGIDPDIKSKQTRKLWTNLDYRTKQVGERKKRWTPEYRAQHAQRMKNSHLAMEALIHRNHLPVSLQTRQKLRYAHLGLKRSKESRRKQGLSISGDKNHMYGKQHSALCYFKDCKEHGKVRIACPQATCPECKSDKLAKIWKMQLAGILLHDIATKLSIPRRRIFRWLKEARTSQPVI